MSHHHDDPLALLVEALRAEPHPALASRIRRRVSEPRETRPMAALRRYGFALAATSVAIVALGMGLWSRQAGRVDPGPAAGADVPSQNASPAVVVSPVATMPTAPGAGVRTVGNRAADRLTAPDERVTPAAPAGSPDLAVLTDQPDVLRHLWRRASAAASWETAEAESPSSPATSGPEELKVAPLDVAPIVVTAAAPVPAGATPIIRRVADAAAARSAR